MFIFIYLLCHYSGIIIILFKKKNNDWSRQNNNDQFFIAPLDRPNPIADCLNYFAWFLFWNTFAEHTYSYFDTSGRDTIVFRPPSCSGHRRIRNNTVRSDL